MSRLSTVVLTALVAGGVSILTGCASAPPLKEKAVSNPLPPISQPNRPVGYKVISLRDGKEEVSTLVEQTADTQTWTDSLGCRAVVSRTGYSPAIEFANCEGDTGSQKVKLLRGTPYPLALGGKWAYSFSGTNTRGDQWAGERECEVKGTARVTTGTGEHDTYKVICRDSTRSSTVTRTYYVSPALQTSVLMERRRVRYWTGAPPPDSTRWEFVRQEP
jgi:hypothetical protein